MIPKRKLPIEIIEKYGLMVSTLCRRMLQDEETAKDAAQEVWLEVIRSYPTFRGEAKISTWIYTIARRVIMRQAQNEQIYSVRFLKDYFHGRDIPAPDSEDIDHKIWVKEMCDKCLTGTLHCLENETRLAYIFRDIARLTYHDIAEIMEKDENAVRQLISRTRKKLRSFLNDECALFNPKGKCHCRMKKMVTAINLPEEYEKIRKSVRSVNLYLESQKIMPGKNYWQK